MKKYATTEERNRKEKEKEKGGDKASVEQEEKKEEDETSAEQEGLLALPDELKITFSSFLNASDVLTLSRVNTNLRFLATDNELWRSLFIRDFFHLFSYNYQQEILSNKSEKSNQNWQQLYRKCFEANKNVHNIPSQYRNIFICAYMGDSLNIPKLFNSIKETDKLTSIAWIITCLKDQQGACLLQVAAADNNLLLIVTLTDYITGDKNKENFMRQIKESLKVSLKVALKNGHLNMAVQIALCMEQVLEHRNELTEAINAIELELPATSTICQSLEFLLNNDGNHSSTLDWIRKAQFFPEAEKFLVEEYGEEHFRKEALRYAIEQGNLDYVKYLVEQWKLEINPSETNPLGLLYYAVFHASIPIAEYLITSGAYIQQKSGVLVIDAALKSQNLAMFIWVVDNLKQTKVADKVKPIIKEMLQESPENLNNLFLINLVRKLKTKGIDVTDSNDPSLKFFETIIETLTKGISKGNILLVDKIKIIRDMHCFAKEFAGALSHQVIFKAWHQEFREKYPHRFPLLELIEEKPDENKSKFHKKAEQAPAEGKHDESIEDNQIVNQLKGFIGGDSVSLISDLIDQEKVEKLNSETNQIKVSSSGRCVIS